MVRHIIIAAWRNMAANRLISAISILGLSIGIAAALLMALVIWNQLSFDHFIPGYEQTYLVRSEYRSPESSRAQPSDGTPADLAAILRSNLPEIEASTRTTMPRHISNRPVVTLRQGAVMGDEIAYWADPNFFDVFPLPVFRGDLASALRRPDGLVLTRTLARKYFGRDDAVGQTILVDDHPMIVRAVLVDFPVNATAFNGRIFLSGLAAFSPLAKGMAGELSPVVTHFRLKPEASLAALQRRWPDIERRFQQRQRPGVHYSLQPIRLDRMVFLDAATVPRLIVAGLTGTLILLVAAINFINLLTARATQRAREVGVRKVCGAGRAALALQFLGEAVLAVLFAAVLAVTLCEWLLPLLNAFLDTGATLTELETPAGFAVLLAALVALGLVAGAWPALVLSGFRPAGVLKGLLPHAGGGDMARGALVVLQFAILVGLAVAATVIYQQDRFAARDGLRGDIDRMLVIRGGCKPGFREALRHLPGVAGAACTDITFFEGQNETSLTAKGREVHFAPVTLDPGVLALYGFKPLAGALPPPTSAGDRDKDVMPRLVLNATAVRAFGFASPGAAIGLAPPGFHGAPLGGGRRTPAGVIVAVVPDFSFHPLSSQAIAPTLFSSAPNPFGDDDDMVSVRLRGQRLPETLAAIDRLWAASNPGLPVNRFFLDAYMQELYLDLLRQAQLFAIFSAIAIFLACLGLLGLSLSTAERRTKEIGVRKAMGATTQGIVALLLWQFSRPVLLASLIACPMTWWLMQRWLSRFAYHVDLHWWVFAGASLGALAVALLTVAGQAFLTARQKPVLALRYE